jgi:hypothetical protein
MLNSSDSSTSTSMGTNRPNLRLNTRERLSKILLNEHEKPFPMISLPENDQYWSEGWKYSPDLFETHEELVISSSSLSTPLSSASSSPSPTPSNQSNNSKVLNLNDLDVTNEQNCRDSFVGKVKFYK